ncbi:hypothetical protein NEF87_004452 [Candidatus Lokiarchaeum ossiferum]|uniref:Flagellin n=1 Tax=Candidatus Lokiarchaeum ossiferum TaxID=2951803 RepID=A0ABY6HXB8_9ARCH|nr:hypothetical protein NEF87_004452 [Candidatus Lokiarchaeum sp. B-35]
MQNKYVEYKRKKRSKVRKASEGMTAAIILIAFIITAAGIAFVILTMGSEMQLELGKVGSEGKDASSSAMQVEGGIITGYTAASAVQAYGFNIKLVLSTGQVDLSSDSISVWLSVNHGEETDLAYDANLETLANASAEASNEYDINWYDGTGDVLTGNEMARFLISSTTGATESQEVLIVINSGVATLKIELSIPIGLVAAGSNILQ